MATNMCMKPAIWPRKVSTVIIAPRVMRRVDGQGFVDGRAA
jgi:hypothetical protein